MKILLILLTILSCPAFNLKANAHDLRDEINNFKDSVYSGNSTPDMIERGNDIIDIKNQK